MRKRNLGTLAPKPVKAPKNWRLEFLMRLEEKWRQERLNDLDQRFQMVMEHISLTKQINDQYYQKMRELAQVTGRPGSKATIDLGEEIEKRLRDVRKTGMNPRKKGK